MIYISAKTPFLSAVKRVEKLLHLSEKRLIQSAATIAKQSGGKKRKRGGGADEDEILDIAETVDRQKRLKKGGKAGGGDNSLGEGVVLKGTGKAIQKVMELGLWFQQKKDYIVRLRTGSVAAIDDITVDEDGVLGAAASSAEEKESKDNTKVGAAEDQEMDEGDTILEKEAQSGIDVVDSAQRVKSTAPTEPMEPVSKTRIRYTSSLEVAVSLR